MKKFLAISIILSTSLLLNSCKNNTEEQKIINDLDLEIAEFLEENTESDLDKNLNEKDEIEIIKKTKTKEISDKKTEETKEDINKNIENKNSKIVKTIDDFAKCITKNGAKAYGTTWCSHCKTQQEMFGDASKNLDFTDCDANRELCKDAGIIGYPTWKINGEQFPGVQSFEFLGEKTGCKLELQN